MSMSVCFIVFGAVMKGPETDCKAWPVKVFYNFYSAYHYKKICEQYISGEIRPDCPDPIGLRPAKNIFYYVEEVEIGD